MITYRFLCFGTVRSVNLTENHEKVKNFRMDVESPFGVPHQLTIDVTTLDLNTSRLPVGKFVEVEGTAEGPTELVSRTVIQEGTASRMIIFNDTEEVKK